MALNNLRAELVRIGVKQYEVASFLGMTPSNFNKKLSEDVPFTVDEIRSIRNEYLPKVSIDKLCESDGDVPTEREKEIEVLDDIENMLDGIDAGPNFYEALAEIREETLRGENEVG